MSDPVREFLRGTVLLEGGLVEDAPDGLDAVLPSEASRRLEVPDAVRIDLSSAEPAEREDVLDGRIGSTLLERLVARRIKRPAVAAVELPAGLPLPLPDDLPVLLNAVRAGRIERRRTHGRFLAVDLRVTLHGEEVRSVIAAVTIRLEDGARTEAFRLAEAHPTAASPLDERERASVHAALVSWLWREGATLHATALDTLRRRAARDLEQLTDYYASLDREMAKAVERARTDDERARRHAKWAALPADLEARREQIRVRVRPRLAARLLGATLVTSAVEHFDIPVRRRKRKGIVTVHGRTADGVVEGPACAACGLATLRVYLCDDRLHPLCESCGQTGKLDGARCAACRGARAERPLVVLDDPTSQFRIGPVPETE